MEIKDTDYILCYAIGSAPGSDFLLTCLKRQQGDWEIEYRFRYHVDKKAFDSQDKKNFYSGSRPGDVDEKDILESLEMIISTVKILYTDVSLTLVQGDSDKFIYMFAQEDSFNMKKLSKEEMENIKTFKGGE